MGTLTGNVKKCEKHPSDLCWLWEWEAGTVCPKCGATQTFLHQNESESEGSGLIENLFGFKVLRNPPSQ